MSPAPQPHSRPADESGSAAVHTCFLSADGAHPDGGGVIMRDHRAVHVPCPARQAFAPIRRIGGRTGWYYGNWLWRLRGWLDVLAGGCGIRPGRRHD